VDGVSDELRDEIASDVRFALSNICRDYLVRGGGRWTEAVIDAVLALPALQQLVAEAAEAARLREAVERVEALASDLESRGRHRVTESRRPDNPVAKQQRSGALARLADVDLLRRALDGD
jgi:hypothetical protein